jgi:hypothetical protein
MPRDAGAGRGFVNPATVAEMNDPNYMTPSMRYELESERKRQREQKKVDEAYEEATKHSKGGMAHRAHERADGIAERGHTKCKIMACKGGMYK